MSWMLTLSPAVAPAAVIGSTAMGIWFVVRLVIHFQKDFTDRYAAELARLEKRRHDDQTDMDALTAARRGVDHDLANAYNYIDKLKRVIRAAGLEVPHDD